MSLVEQWDDWGDWWLTPGCKLIRADCRDAMAAMDADSTDGVVSDPPYGLGFMGKGWDHGVPGIEFWREALRVLKPGGHLLAFGGTRTFHRLTVAIEDAGFEIRDCLSWLYGSGFPKSMDVSKAIDKAAGPEAERWQGWGTALKPAWEPIVVARKPLIGTVAANVLEHGTGAINIDATRIDATGGRPRIESKNEPARNTFGDGLHGSRAIGTTTQGRWPANVMLAHHEDCGDTCHPDCPVHLLDGQTGQKGGGYGISGKRTEEGRRTMSGGMLQGTGETIGYGDSGGASRFFYNAKVAKKERNLGLPEGMTNKHPTCKPVKVMAWLCRLVTPPGGVVLDPFMGSGSTGVAAVSEGFRFVGIDLDEDGDNSCEVARHRIAHALDQRAAP